jgi:hypothetical protein
MKKKISIMLLFIFLCSFVFPPLALSEEKIWVDLATSVDENGTPITSSQYGYYVEVPDLGRVFVVCDPSTGKETEEAYIPNATIGETEMLTGYEYRSCYPDPIRCWLQGPQQRSGREQMFCWSSFQ